MKKGSFNSALRYYRTYDLTHNPFSLEGVRRYKKEFKYYDPVKKQQTFHAMLKVFEGKLTKAKQKRKIKKLSELEKDVYKLINGRRQEFGDFDCKGFGTNGVGASSTACIKYNNNGEANIIVEFKPEHMVLLSGEEVKELLGGKSLNKKLEAQAKSEKDQEEQLFSKDEMEVIIPASNVFEKTQNIVGYEICSYDTSDACGCDEYEMY